MPSTTQITVAIATGIAALMYWYFYAIKNVVKWLPTGQGEYLQRRRREITDIVIHHSGAENQGPWDYARYHTRPEPDGRGWPGIGYHYVIQPNGAIFQTQRLTTVSNHVAGHNSQAVGICLSGNLSRRPMTEAQRRAARRLIRRLQILLPSIQTIAPHSAYTGTSCPGTLTDVSDLIS